MELKLTNMQPQMPISFTTINLPAIFKLNKMLKKKLDKRLLQTKPLLMHGEMDSLQAQRFLLNNNIQFFPISPLGIKKPAHGQINKSMSAMRQHIKVMLQLITPLSQLQKLNSITQEQDLLYRNKVSQIATLSIMISSQLTSKPLTPLLKPIDKLQLMLKRPLMPGEKDSLQAQRFLLNNNIQFFPISPLGIKKP